MAAEFEADQVINFVGAGLVVLDAIRPIDLGLNLPVDMTNRFRVARPPNLCGCDRKYRARAYVAAYNFAKHLKALRWRTPFNATCDAWTKDRSALQNQSATSHPGTVQLGHQPDRRRRGGSSHGEIHLDTCPSQPTRLREWPQNAGAAHLAAKNQISQDEEGASRA